MNPSLEIGRAVHRSDAPRQGSWRSYRQPTTHNGSSFREEELARRSRTGATKWYWPAQADWRFQGARSRIGTLRDDIYELFLTTLHAPLSTDLMPAKRNWHDAVVLAPRSGTGLRKQTGYSRAFSVFIPLSSDLLPLFHLVSDAKRTFENALSLWFSTTTNTNCFIISLLNLCLSASANRESPDASASFSILLFWKNGILI